MLTRYNAVDIERILRAENPPPPFPPASDRDTWAAVRQTIGEDEAQAIIQGAEVAATAAIPVLPASLYLEFKRTGERPGYQNPRNERRKNHTILTLAECLEYKGRFLDPIMDLTWAICEESSWASPAHQGELTDLDFPSSTSIRRWPEHTWPRWTCCWEPNSTRWSASASATKSTAACSPPI